MLGTVIYDETENNPKEIVVKSQYVLFVISLNVDYYCLQMKLSSGQNIPTTFRMLYSHYCPRSDKNTVRQMQLDT